MLEVRGAKSREKKGDHEGAIRSYQKIIDSKPKTAQAQKAQLAIGEIYYEKLDQKPKAIEVFQKILEDNPDSDEAKQVLWKLGSHFFKLADYERAGQSFNKLFVSYPHSELGINAHLMSAKCYEEGKKFEMAAQSYYAFALLHPGHYKALTALSESASIYAEKLKRPYDAINVYQQIVRKYGREPEASQVVANAKSQLINLKAEVPAPDPEKLSTFEGRMQARRDMRRERLRPFDPLKAAHEKAQGQNTNVFGYDDVDLIREFQAAIPGGSPDGQGTIDDAAHMIANMYYQQEDYAKAGSLFLRIAEKSPKDASIYWKLGRCYEKLGFEQKARESYKTAISRDKNVLQEMIATAEKEYDMEDYDKAISRYQSILGLGRSQDDSLVYHRIGLSYLRLKDLKKAQTSFENSVALLPTVSNQDSLQHLAAIFEEFGMPLKAAIYQDAADGKTNDFKVEREFGNLCYSYQSYDWARIKYQAAFRLASDPKTSIDMKVKAALSAAKKGMLDLAKSELIKLDAEEKDDASVHYGFGVLAYDSGNFDEAVAKFVRSLQLDPNSDEAIIALGDAYYAKGEIGQARKNWEEYLKRNPHDQTIKDKLKKLR